MSSYIDDIVSELRTNGFFVDGDTVQDAEYKRLLSDLTLIEPQPFSLLDLYSQAGEPPRVFGVKND